jgi:hypothetical protein
MQAKTIVAIALIFLPAVFWFSGMDNVLLIRMVALSLPTALLGLLYVIVVTIRSAWKG